MGNYTYITKYTAKSFSKILSPKTRIMIHHWGDDGQEFGDSKSGIIRWFTKLAGTSAHYVVEDSQVACLVPPKYVAWHAGNWAENLRCYGIECRPEMTDGDLETLAEVIADIWKSHKKKLKLVYHGQVKSTACPGRYKAKMKWLEARATEIYEGSDGKRFYTVKRGDNLSTIASKYKTTVSKIMKLNPQIKNKDVINVGQKIRVK